MSTRRRWSLLVPALGVLAAVALLPVGSSRALPLDLREVVSYLVTWVPLTVATVVAVSFAVRRHPEPWWRALRLPLGLMGLVVAVFVGLAARTIAILLEAVTTNRIGAGMPSIDGGAPSLGSVVLFVGATIVVAPVVEELFFRGALLPAFEERLGTGRAAGWIAVILVAVVFSAVHALAGAGALSVLVTFLAGVGFGAVARSHGVGCAVVSHTVFNATGLALAASAAGVSPLYPTLGLG